MLRIESVGKSFASGGALFGARTKVAALSDVSLHVAKGESLGLVGESGSGKSTLARCVMMLDRVTEGRIRCARASKSCFRTLMHRSIRA
jgi:peptide/nickel transport system ATP-binding protein